MPHKPVDKFEMPKPSFDGKWKYMWIAAGVLVVAAVVLIALSH